MRMNYYIIYTARTGSTLLYNYLKQLGFGMPYALINDSTLPPEQRTMDGLKANLESRRVGNYCGAKVVWANLHYIHEHIQEGLSAYDVLYELLEDPKFIYLYRHDIIAQAVSHLKHQLLDRLHVKNETDRKTYKEMEARLSTEKTKDELYAELHLEIARIWKDRRCWELFFKRHKIEPLDIAFEDFIGNKTGTLEGICHFLGNPISLSENNLIETTQRVKSSLDDKWYGIVMNFFERLY